MSSSHDCSPTLSLALSFFRISLEIFSDLFAVLFFACTRIQVSVTAALTQTSHSLQNFRLQKYYCFSAKFLFFLISL